VKSFGAYIACHECGAQPYPKVGEVWCCELHRVAKPKRASRAVAATPVEAVNEFERILAAQTAQLEDVVSGCDDDGVVSALKEHTEEVERALGELKAAIAAQTPPRAEKTAQSKRMRLKPISALEHDRDGLDDLLTDPKEGDV
jgi:uncharacterized Zn finger protein (UPF0148 family)